MNEELTIQKLHWDNIKQGYPYIEADDDNNDYKDDIIQKRRKSM